APALLHILTHRRVLSGGGALALPEALLVAGAHRSFVAFARARNRLGRQVIDLLKLVAERLPNADSLRCRRGWRNAESDRCAASRRYLGRCRRRSHWPSHW